MKTRKTPKPAPKGKTQSSTRSRAGAASPAATTRRKPASQPVAAKSKAKAPAAPRKQTRRAASPPPAPAAAAPAKSAVAAPLRKAARTSPARRIPARPPQPEVPSILLEGDTPPPPPAHGPGQRYALGPSAPPPHAVSGEPGELPEAYGTQRLIVAARDPRWLYVHWDFTTQQQRDFNRRAADGHLHVRVFLDKPGSQPHTEVAVHPESRNWFVHVGHGGARYVAQIGYYDKRRRWHLISESDATFTPPDSLSDDTTARFATVPPDVTFERLVAVVKEAAREHLPLAQAIAEMLQASGPATEDALPSRPAAALPPELRAAAAAAPPASWTAEQDRALAQFISMDTVRRVWIGSLEITELVRRRLARELASQAAVPAAPLPGVGGPASLASPFGGLPSGPKGFWFNVNAELIIYGATEPDASVTIGGRAIQLRPDGSFSYRFALPDGQYDLPIVAVSADKSEGRGADLHFTRHTEYLGEVGAHPQDPALQTPLPENL